jgi:hypothetical protein
MTVNKCATCRGTGYVLAYRPQIFETDDSDEIEDAYLMARRPCPDCNVEVKK